MNRKKWAIASFIFIMLTVFINFFGYELFHIQSREGIIIVVMLTAIAFILALIGKGIWRTLTFIVIVILIGTALFSFWFIGQSLF
ncbi:hypothetical protein [Virgibacillus halodenitrificans]|uniref:DUF3953 domain-containing protein n=1 Tax=Virgibacillus halodenitrificans TaxID=1482 RepID=A0ABR7VJI1_VIRHA|nr:hypothetical protein [Virgibacillus halodenitrificans]MBD1221843.1 hypothetical protein [Virgibacillus halodenitrificans]